MSHIRVKTEYNVESAYGTIEKKTLYVHHNLSCDVVSFYDENGRCLFSVDDTMENNLIDAIIRLYTPRNPNSSDLIDGVQPMDSGDEQKIENAMF